MACSLESLMAREASCANQPRSRPFGSCSAAPVKCHFWSQTSTQVWLPRLFTQLGMPTTRAGTPTDRQVSTNRMDKPVQEASPLSIDSDGLWGAFLRCVEYFTFTRRKSF